MLLNPFYILQPVWNKYRQDSFNRKFLKMDLRKYYNSTLHSDVTLVYSGRELPVHKIVLSSQSKWFARAFEGQFSESESPRVELVGDDPDALEGMVRRFYGWHISSPAPGTAEEPNDDGSDSGEAFTRLSKIIKIYVTADKYDGEALRKELISEFNTIANRVWKSADFFTGGHMEKLLTEMYNDLAESDPLRQNVAARIADIMPGCHKTDTKLLGNMLERLPDLARDVVLKLAARGAQDVSVRFPLHWAAQNGDTTECRRLIDSGMEVDALDDNGERPLHFSTFHGMVDTTRYLISSGANLNTASTTYPHGTPLRWASRQGHLEIVRILQEAGAVDPPPT